MPHSHDAQTYVGTLIELNVGGEGPNSAQLEFSIAPLKGAGEPQTFVVQAAEPQVFTAMATLLTAAYMAKMIVTVGYVARPAQTPMVTNVKLGGPDADGSRSRMGFT
ncbi:MAG: hypothetical protein JO234_08810 [Hyphomicrobiales bacterium]|nr:hypothetical protein [Hyphomicrobiales bacterium]